MGLCPKPNQEPEVPGLPDSLRASFNQLRYTTRIRVALITEKGLLH